MRMPADMLFIPRWLAVIDPYAEGASAGLTAKAVTPDSLWRKGQIAMACSGTIVTDLAEREAEVVGARRARKERMRGEHTRAGEARLYGRMDARAGRRAAREARRIMMDIRRRLTDAFTREDM